MHNRFLQLGFGETVLFGESEMAGELFETARGDKARYGDEAAVALG